MNKHFKPIFNGFQFKIAALVLLIFGRTGIELGTAFLSRNNGDRTALFLYMGGYLLYFMALPIVAFLVTEGIVHTERPVAYLVRMLVAAVVTEFVLDFSIFGADVFLGKYSFAENPAIQGTSNLYVTLLFGTVACILIDKVYKPRFREGTFAFIVLSIVTVSACCFLDVLLKGEQGAFGVLTVVAMYLFKDSPVFTLIAVAILQILTLGQTTGFVIMYAPIIGILVTWFYNSEKGRESIALRIIGYAAYPVCYAILILIMRKMGMI